MKDERSPPIMDGKILTPESIEEILANLQPQYKQLLEPYNAEFDKQALSKQYQYLFAENKTLNQELKRINELLTFLIEFKQGIHLPPIKKDLEIPPLTEVTEKDLRSISQQIILAETEYTKLKERVEQVQDPKYLADLKERVVSLSLKLKKMEKGNKKIEVNNWKKDNSDDLESLKQETAMGQDLQFIESKIKEQENKIFKQAETLKEQTCKLLDMRMAWKNVSEEGRAAGLEINDTIGLIQRGPKEEIKFSDSEIKRQSLEKTLNLLKTRYNVAAGEYAQKKMQLQAQINSVSEILQKKSEYFFEDEIHRLCNKNKGELNSVVSKMKINFTKVIENSGNTPRDAELSRKNVELLKGPANFGVFPNGKIRIGKEEKKNDDLNIVFYNEIKY